MRIAFFEIQDWERPLLEEAFKEHELFFSDQPLQDSDLSEIKDFEALSVFIYSRVGKEIIDTMPNLRLIATRSTGYDHIDLVAAKTKGVIVSNVPTYGEHTVAEHTFALILALSRNVHKSHVRRLKNDFSIEGLKGFDLKGKTIGVIGAGKIGLHVIRIARGFGMHVLAYDAFQNGFLSDVLDFDYVPLDRLLAESDIISLHTPYNEKTHHLINEHSIAKIKRGSLLVNTARGELVDNDALIQALDQGILAGAGLDVIEGEQLIKEEKELLSGTKVSSDLSELVNDHNLLRRDNVVYTPHIAFYSEEALHRILRTTIENITCFTEGACQNTVGN
ncbi:MAG: hydroxyacid dehydrogenase [Candidatus Moraniibacteriota bacterium]|nr:MAG: hydroxyacid dehydrogenase [Candidatus Moranbacteria bacterium]